ncbi:SBBP repeat-containing protein [Rurimicrobium arvi]|uniref:DUF7948 domain-containing protein n=1 Tax=Rurimicrobium arvi TaxID=2049916 RepID=UPI0031E472A9
MNLFIGNGSLHYQWTRATQDQADIYRMDVTLIGADTNARVLTEQQQPYTELHYRSGNTASAHAYQKITYKNAYPNIDWVLYVRDSKVEYDFVVHPGGKVSDIALQYGGTIRLSSDNQGNLIAVTPAGTITEAAPVSYLLAGKKPIASAYETENNTVRFKVSDYSGTLVIDPALSWCTYLGGSMDDRSNTGCVSVDTAGYVYLAGYTNSTAAIATTGAYQTTLGGNNDAYVAKFSKTGAMKWCTYYGGTGQDYATGITCDGAGNVYFCGYSNSTTAISTTGSYQATIGGGTDGFLVKLDSTGTRKWATYIGGTATDQAMCLSVDSTGNLYVGGYTQSSSAIATTGSYQATYGGVQDAFLFKFSGSGSRIWSTYFGGTSTDAGLSVRADKAWNVYLTGYTKSSTAIASTGAYQTTIGGGEDIFVAKFDSSGARQWSTYMGGSANDRGLSITSDPSDHIYLTGYALSTSGIATAGSYQTASGGLDEAFLAKFMPSGSLSWATYYGSGGYDDGYSIQCDNLNHVYMLGVSSSSSGIASTGAMKDTLSGSRDGMLVKFDTSGARIWASYFGGNDNDLATSLYCTPLSELYIGGSTASTSDLATAGSYQSGFGGNNYDAFLVRINDCVLTAPATVTGNDTVCRGLTYTYSVAALPGAVSYTWTLPSGWSGSSTTNSISVTAGAVGDTIRVIANYLCGSSTITLKPVYVQPLPLITPSVTVQICDGDSTTFTASSGAAYQWLSSGSGISGANAASYKARHSGIYSVVVTSAFGCADTSLTDSLIVHPLPVPVIIASGSLLSTGLFSSYQWNHNGSPITGATNQTYTLVLTTGTYSVTVTDSNGCSATSTAYLPPTAIAELNSGHAVSVYPNPAQDYFSVTGAVAGVSVLATDGRLLLHSSDTNKVDISGLPAGLYLLQFYDTNGLFTGTQKLIKSTSNNGK